MGASWTRRYRPQTKQLTGFQCLTEQHANLLTFAPVLLGLLLKLVIFYGCKLNEEKSTANQAIDWLLLLNRTTCQSSNICASPALTTIKIRRPQWVQIESETEINLKRRIGRATLLNRTTWQSSNICASPAWVTVKISHLLWVQIESETEINLRRSNWLAFIA